METITSLLLQELLIISSTEKIVFETLPIHPLLMFILVRECALHPFYPENVVCLLHLLHMSIGPVKQKISA